MNGSGLLLVLIFGLLLAAVLALFLPHPRSWTKASTPANRQLPRVVFRDDDQYWYGFFYNNPDDPDLFVPKRYGLGWTVNFGHPLGKWVMIGTLLLPVALLILNVLVSGTAPIGCHPSGCHLLP